MDPISHAALGAACSQALLYKYDRKNAWLVGGLAALAPDLDMLIKSSHNPMLFMIYHRQFTHSLLFAPFGGLAVAFFLLLFNRFRQSWRLTIVAALIGYSTHAVLDACTSYGTVLLWPFSHRRISWDLVSIIDPVFTLPLMLGIFYGVFYKQKKALFAGLSVPFVLLCFNLWQHHRALDLTQVYAKEKGLILTNVRALPQLLSSTNWLVVAFFKKNIWLSHVSTPVFSQSRLRVLAEMPRFQSENLPDLIKKNSEKINDFRIFKWFTDGYLFKIQEQPLTLVDARFLSGSEPIMALWGIQFLPSMNHAKVVYNQVILNKNYQDKTK